MTIYISNFLCVQELNDEKFLYDKTRELIQKIIDAAKNSDAVTIFVSNEVGAGIVPENKLARHFRDLAGLANQMLAAQADKVFLTVAGLAVDLKKLEEKF